MTGTAPQESSPHADEVASENAEQVGGENADEVASENAEQVGGENVNANAKQNANGSKKASGVRYLSDFISEIPDTRRIKFIVNLKAAIREGQFDGSPIAETFALSYTGRGSNGPEERETNQRDFVVENTPAFKTWLATEAQAPSTRPKYPSRVQLEGGQASLAEMADKFRQRGSTGSRRKARR